MRVSTRWAAIVCAVVACNGGSSPNDGSLGPGGSDGAIASRSDAGTARGDGGGALPPDAAGPLGDGAAAISDGAIASFDGGTSGHDAATTLPDAAGAPVDLAVSLGSRDLGTVVPRDFAMAPADASMRSTMDAAMSACSSSMPTTLASNVDSPLKMRVDDRWVYWLAPSTGSLHRMPKAGGAVETIASNLGTPMTAADWDFEVDSSLIYVMRSGHFGTNPQPGAVDLYDKSGHLVRTVVTHEGTGDCHMGLISHIAVAAGNLYWIQINGSSTSDCPQMPDSIVWLEPGQALGSTIATGSTSGGILGIAADPWHVFFSDARGILRVPATGGAMEIVVPDVIAGPLWSGGSDLFFTDGFKLYRVTAPNGWHSIYDSPVGDVVESGSYLYTTTGNIKLAFITRMGIDGTAPEPLATDASIIGIAVDDQFVYYTSSSGTSIDRVCK